MPGILIDTNVILRLFDTTSNPAQTAKTKRLFELAKAGDSILVVAPPALFEVAWVLRSTLKWVNNDILDVLEAIINWPGVKVLDKDRVKTAIASGRRCNGGFADSYLAATAEDHNLEVATFDEKHFKKFGVALYEMK